MKWQWPGAEQSVVGGAPCFAGGGILPWIAAHAPVNDNQLIDWISQEFGEPNNLTVEFVPCPRSQELEKLNM